MTFVFKEDKKQSVEETNPTTTIFGIFNIATIKVLTTGFGELRGDSNKRYPTWDILKVE